jgi:predicted DNA-binding protein
MAKNTLKATEDDILNRVLTPTEDRERMIRFTADLPESLHRKLTMLAAKSGKKKVEIVRAILEEVLKDVDE